MRMDVEQNEIQCRGYERQPDEQRAVCGSSQRGEGIGKDEEYHQPVDQREGRLKTTKPLDAGSSRGRPLGATLEPRSESRHHLRIPSPSFFVLFVLWWVLSFFFFPLFLPSDFPLPRGEHEDPYRPRVSLRFR